MEGNKTYDHRNSNKILEQNILKEKKELAGKKGSDHNT